MFIAFFLSFILSLVFTPIAKKIAFKNQVLDFPSSRRKMHRAPVPYLGGVSIFGGFIVPLILYFPANVQMIGVLFCSTLIVLLGVCDDIFSIRAIYKLGGQLSIAALTVFYGVSISYLNLPYGITISLGVFGIPLTIIWIVGVINTINLVDGVDGLASGVTIIAALFFALVSYLFAMPTVMFLSLALAGACLGFLKYNYNPASIFMGDAGSMLLGYVLAVLSILVAYSAPTPTFTLLVPILILGFPILDTIFSIFRRFVLKERIFAPDKRHFHHHLVRKGFSPRQTVILIYITTFMTGVAAISSFTLSVMLNTLIFVVVAVIISIFVVMFRKKRKRVIKFFNRFF